MISHSLSADSKDHSNDEIIITVYFGHSGENIVNKKTEAEIKEQAEKNVVQKHPNAQLWARKIKQAERKIVMATTIIDRKSVV